MSKKKLILFTLDGCIHCTNLKKRLDSESIKFIEIEIDANSKIWDKIVEQTGNDYVPTLYIMEEGKDEGLIFTPDNDFNDEDEAIELVKNNLN